MYTMGDVARCSIEDEEILYQMFGVNAELLIDHAWGWEPCTMDQVKSYQPENSSFCSGQVLQSPYSFEKARLVVQEMAESAALDLVDKRMMTDQLVLTVGYDRENLLDPEIRRKYHGEITVDGYGRKIPKHAHGTANLPKYSSSTRLITESLLALFDSIVNRDLLIRRLTVETNHVINEQIAAQKTLGAYEQLNLFTDYEALERKRRKEEEALAKERKMQEAMLAIKKKFGKKCKVLYKS